MSAPAQFYEVRYRIGGIEPTEWVTQVFPASADITLDNLTRGLQYDIQIRAVARNGRKSNWVVVSSTVATTLREGAAALPTNAVANQASMWDLATSVTWAATSDAEGVSTATISVTSGRLVVSSVNVNYAPSSATVTGTAGQTVTYYLYYDDPQLQGGSLELGLADNIVASANVDGRIAVSSVAIKFPAAGTSSTGGGSIGGGGGSGGAGSCPSVDAWVIERVRGLIRAGDVQVGDWLLGLAGAYRRVTYSGLRTVPGVQISTEQFHKLTCSATAPILTDAGFVSAPEVIGRTTVVRGETVERRELLTGVVHLGDIDVQHITLDATDDTGHVFWVGDEPEHLFPHHNLKQVDNGL